MSESTPPAQRRRGHGGAEFAESQVIEVPLRRGDARVPEHAKPDSLEAGYGFEVSASARGSPRLGLIEQPDVCLVPEAPNSASAGEFAQDALINELGDELVRPGLVQYR